MLRRDSALWPFFSYTPGDDDAAAPGWRDGFQLICRGPAPPDDDSLLERD